MDNSNQDRNPGHETVCTVLDPNEEREKETRSSTDGNAKHRTERKYKPDIELEFGTQDSNFARRESVPPPSVESQPNSEEAQTHRESKVKPISEARRAASRANGKLSRGPKTEFGKSRSRYNPLKHGHYAKAATILHPRFGEGRDLRKILSDLRKDLEPVGASEELVVEQIAVYHLRLVRATRYESAMLESQIDENALLLRPCGVFCGVEEIRQAINEVQTEGLISEELEHDLIENARVTSDISDLNGKIRLDAEQGICDLESHKLLIDHLQLQLQSAELQEKAIQKEDQQRTRVLRNRLALPDSATLESLVRLDQSINKQLDRAYDRLFQLQARRMAKEKRERNSDEE